MNPFIQNVLAISALIMALGFLIQKFFFKKKASTKACGDYDCDCH